MKGTKEEEGKRRWDLVPFRVLGFIVDAITFGTHKYEDDNWKKVEEGENKYFAAMERHISQYREALEENDISLEFDKQSGLHCLAHAGCDLIFVFWFAIKRIIKNGKDSFKK